MADVSYRIYSLLLQYLFYQYDLKTAPAMDFRKIYKEKITVRNYVIIGVFMGALFASTEYFIKLQTDDPQDFAPLIVACAK